MVDVSTNKLVGLVLLLVFLVVAIGIFLSFSVSSTDLAKFGCWASNGIKSGSSIFGSLIPSACKLIPVEEKAAVEDITMMLTDTWWMYHQGNVNLGATASDNSVFKFIAKDEMSFEDITKRLIQYKGDAKVTNLKDSDFNYLQEGSEGPTLCAGISIVKNNWKLNKDASYYINYFDSNRIVEILNVKDVGDKVVISSTPNIKQENNYYCPSYANPQQGITIFMTSVKGMNVIGAKTIS